MGGADSWRAISRGGEEEKQVGEELEKGEVDRPGGVELPAARAGDDDAAGGGMASEIDPGSRAVVG